MCPLVNESCCGAAHVLKRLQLCAQASYLKDWYTTTPWRAIRQPRTMKKKGIEKPTHPPTRPPPPQIKNAIVDKNARIGRYCRIINAEGVKVGGRVWVAGWLGRL